MGVRLSRRLSDALTDFMWRYRPGKMQKALSTAAVLLCDLDKVEFVS